MPTPNLVTPCCGAPFFILTAYERGQEVPDEVCCDAEGCNNTWSRTGVASPYNTTRSKETNG